MRNYILLFALVLGLSAAINLGLPAAAAAETKVHRKTQRPAVELYVTSWCPYCTKAKAFFDQRGIDYQVYDIERDANAARRKQQLDAGRGVPFAIINGIKISGWSSQAYQAALENYSK